MKKSKEETPAKKGWLDCIADRTNYSRKIVQDFIKKYNIPQSPGIGNPKRIHIVSITFSGTKRGVYDNNFEFLFDKLEPGIWGLFSDGNGKGKTTALEVIKWLFKGRVSEGLQLGVKNWIRCAELIFRINDTKYSISIEQYDELFHGEIKRGGPTGDLHPFKEFNSEEEMSVVVSEFMLEQLDLGQFASFRQGDNELEEGREIMHGWPALASAMFIGTSYGAIFGDHATSGLPNRILNMYMGLPWIPTHAALKALNGRLKSSNTVEGYLQDRAQQNRKRRLEEIQLLLKNKEEQFGSLPALKKSELEYNKMSEVYNVTYESVNQSFRRLSQLRLEFAEVEIAYKADQVILKNFKEDRAANKIFKQLNPVCCPHCEQKVTPQQLEKERAEHKCAICDRTMLDGDDSEFQLTELEANSKATSMAYQELKNALRVREKADAQLNDSLKDQQALLTIYKTELNAERSRESDYLNLQKEITKLKILEAEYKDEDESSQNVTETDVEKQTTRTENVVDEEKILAAAIKETESRFKGLQEELLFDVNKKMLEYCPKIGLTQYIGLNLNSQPSLKILKDGSETSFSKVSKGEQLRLKVLATIALISVAEERKLGRHPGFLIIDSPAAQEVNSADLNNLIAGLKDLRSVLPSLQIILASVANETLLKHVDSNHRKYAEDTGFLW